MEMNLGYNHIAQKHKIQNAQFQRNSMNRQSKPYLSLRTHNCILPKNTKQP